MKAADFSSSSVSGRRGLPTLKPTWLRAYLTGIGLETINIAVKNKTYSKLIKLKYESNEKIKTFDEVIEQLIMGTEK